MMSCFLLILNRQIHHKELFHRSTLDVLKYFQAMNKNILTTKKDSVEQASFTNIGKFGHSFMIWPGSISPSESSSELLSPVLESLSSSPPSLIGMHLAPICQVSVGSSSSISSSYDSASSPSCSSSLHCTSLNSAAPSASSVNRPGADDGCWPQARKH